MSEAKVSVETKTKTTYVVRMNEQEALAVRAFLGKTTGNWSSELFSQLNDALEEEGANIKVFDETFEYVGPLDHIRLRGTK